MSSEGVAQPGEGEGGNHTELAAGERSGPLAGGEGGGGHAEEDEVPGGASFRGCTSRGLTN